MTKWREGWLKEHVSQLVTEAFEESYELYLEEGYGFSLEEKELWYKRLAHRNGLWGLLRSNIQPLPDVLKAAIRKRVLSMLPDQEQQMHQGVIVEKSAGGLIEEGYLKKLTVGFGTRISCAFGEGGTVQVHSIPADAEDLFEAAKHTQTILKDYRTILYFHHYPDGQIDSGDYQPFPLIAGADKKPSVVAFGEGNFIQFQKEDAHSSAYHLATDYLLETIDALYDECGKDLNKLFARLDSPMLHKSMGVLWKDRGHITLLDGYGRVMHYPAGGMTVQPWGTTSNLLIGSPDAGKAAPTAVAAPNSVLDALATVGTKKKKSATEVPLKAADQAPAATATALPSEAGKDTHLWPPAKLTKGRQIKKWVERHFGKEVKDSCDPAEILKSGLPRSKLLPNSTHSHLKSFADLQAHMAKQADEGAYDDDTEDSISAQVWQPLLPQAREEMLRIFKNSALMDPDKLKEAESETKNVFEELGYSLGDFCRQPGQTYRKMIAQSQYGTAKVIRALCDKIMDLDPTIIGLPTKKTTETKPEVQGTPGSFAAIDTKALGSGTKKKSGADKLAELRGEAA